MTGSEPHTDLAPTTPWQRDIHAALSAAGVSLIGYVPDAGHANLIALCDDDPAMRPCVLTTEEEGIALLGGAWLGGARGALLMQSSGVGNCVNMLTLVENCRFPLLTLVTMRGEWAEFNPWQVPMSRNTVRALELGGTLVHRLERAEDAGETVAAAASLAFDGDQSVAVLIAQRLIGRKVWGEEE